MGYENTQYEEVIDLKDLCIFVLRKWKLLAGMAPAGALALGLYRTSAQYVLIGALLGAFCGAGLLFLRCMFSPKLRNAEELKGCYGYYILNDLGRPREEHGSRFEKLLDQWAGYAKEWDEEKQYRLMGARIQMAMEERPVALMVTGTVEPELLYEAGGKLKEWLPAETFQVCIKENLTYNEEALKQVRRFTAVLVEKAGDSDRREIAKLAEVLRISGARVVGAIVL